MLSFLRNHGRNLFYSQNGEEGILIQCVRRFVDAGVLAHEGAGHAVETGANDGKWCSNTALMIDSYWSATLIEADWDLYQKCQTNYANNPRVRVQCSRVDAKNVNAFVGHDCDLLSLDTDGSDYEIFKGLNAKPKIVIMEIDSSTPPGDEGFNSDGGASYRTGVRLGIDKGYFLLCHTGNLVLVANEYRELFPEIEGDGLNNAELYFNRAWLKAEVPA